MLDCANATPHSALTTGIVIHQILLVYQLSLDNLNELSLGPVDMM